MIPQRIQQRRTKGWRKPAGAVGVGRGTKWGNPYRPIQLGNGTWVAQDDNGVRYPGHGPSDPDGTWPTRAAALSDCVRLFYALEVVYELGAFTRDEARTELAGKDLMCWCPLVDAEGKPVPCHADVLLELANGAPR